MLLDLSRLRGGEEHVERTYEPAAFRLQDEEFRLTAPVALVVDVHKDATKVRLVGRLTAALEVACGRCLEPYGVPVDTRVDLMLLPSGGTAGTGGDEQEIAEDDLGVSFYKDEVIDLGEVMREQFLLALPMKPLCREDCKGLCPICGVNRNRETCTCQAEWVDPRLEGLRRFRSERH